MTKTITLQARRGLTLVELMISVSIMVFIFSTMAYLIFMTGRNFLIMHSQVASQTRATMAMERCSNLLRSAAYFKLDDADTSTAALLSRVQFAVPSSTDYTTLKWGEVVFDTSKASQTNGRGGTVKVFMDSTKVATGTPDYSFPDIEKFSVQWNSPTWLTLNTSYIYHGFSLADQDKDNNGIPDFYLSGKFVTDIIAKNHPTGTGVADYGQTTTTIASL